MSFIKKIYVDTHYMASGSKSTTDFKIEIPQTVQLQDNTVFYVSDICIPNSWYSVEEGFNDRVYLRYTKSGTTNDVILYLEAGSYDGIEFQILLEGVLRSMYNGANNDWTCEYDEDKNTIKITTFNNVSFMLFTDEELKVISTWTGPSYNKNDPCSINSILRNKGVYMTTYNQTNPYESGFLNFLGFNTLYLHSPDLGNFNTIGPQGESSIIKKIPVIASFGNTIINDTILPHDYLDCSKQTLKTVSFRLCDVHGKTIPLHQSNWNFSIIFSSVGKEDI